MIRLFYEVVWDVMFLGLMLWIVLGNQDGDMIYQNKAIEGNIIADIDAVSFCI